MPEVVDSLETTVQAGGSDIEVEILAGRKSVAVVYTGEDGYLSLKDVVAIRDLANSVIAKLQGDPGRSASVAAN